MEMITGIETRKDNRKWKFEVMEWREFWGAIGIILKNETALAKGETIGEIHDQKRCT